MRFIPTNRTISIWRLYLSSMAILFLLRVAFWLYHFNLFPQNQNTDLLLAFVGGMIIDSSVIATTLFAIRLAILPIQLTNWKSSRTLYYIMFNIMVGLYIFINLVDIFYFQMFNSRLNILFLDNLDQMLPIIQTILKDFPVIITMIIWIFCFNYSF